MIESCDIAKKEMDKVVFDEFSKHLGDYQKLQFNSFFYHLQHKDIVDLREWNEIMTHYHHSSSEEDNDTNNEDKMTELIIRLRDKKNPKTLEAVEMALSRMKATKLSKSLQSAKQLCATVHNVAQQNQFAHMIPVSGVGPCPTQPQPIFPFPLRAPGPGPIQYPNIVQHRCPWTYQPPNDQDSSQK